MTRAIESLLAELVSKWSATARIVQVIPLTPDASLRRYYRIILQSGSAAKDTIVAMVFDSVLPPEAGADVVVNSDDAYVELTRFFHTHNIPVPELYVDARTKSVLLIEDVGDILLSQTIIGDLAEKYESSEIDRLYQSAVDIILNIQRLPYQQEFFAFQRGFTAKLNLKEMAEFIDFVLRPLQVTKEKLELVQNAFTVLAHELSQLPQNLAHRDFHSWNLLLDANQALKVIDFQDALLAPKTYDIVALVNDRDTDAALGIKQVERLLEYFREKAQYGEAFYADYYRMLLQRDLKVVGRFSKLAAVRGLTAYRKWIPGTQRRIGRSLQYLVRDLGHDKTYLQLLSVLETGLEDVRVGKEEM